MSIIAISVEKTPVPLLLCLLLQAPQAVEVPVERSAHVFFARATINGQGPFWLTVDTGATLTVIDPATAEHLKLRVQNAGTRPDVGVASGLTPMGTTRGASITVGQAPP